MAKSWPQRLKSKLKVAFMRYEQILKNLRHGRHVSGHEFTRAGKHREWAGLQPLHTVRSG
jgi:hypothetical protein